MMTIDRRLFIAGTAGAALAARAAAQSAPASSLPQATNPLVKQRADAQIFRHDDGYYYLTGSVPEYDRLVLRRSKTLAGLATAEERVLWRHLESGPLSGFIWAPELHLIDGKWVMYFAAGPSGGGEDVFRIRTWAVVCDGPDPMAGKWTVLGQFEFPWDGFNLDSTIFIHRGVRYFCWAQREPGIETNSNLYLAPLKTPLTLAAKPARLTVPTLDWEIQGFKVAEAAAFLERNGKLFLTYSASATDARYSLGLLTADAGADIMDPKAWTKSPEPVFKTSRETGVYGPGHNSFTIDEQGRDILVYHGRDYEAIKGDPLFDPNRHTRIQRLYFKADGTPDFGVPVGNGPLPERFTGGGGYLYHTGTQLAVGSAPLPQTQFRSEPAAGGDGVTIRPILLRDHALAVKPDGGVGLVKDDGSPAFAAASRFRRGALAGGDVQLLPVAQPGRALRAAAGPLATAPVADPATRWKPD